KPQTDDMRESPALIVVNELITRGARVRAFDPEAFCQARIYLKHSSESLELVDDQYEVLRGADGLFLITEWKQFRQPDFGVMKSLLKKPVILDGRNQYDPEKMRDAGFSYYSIGRNA
ncbi:MAG: UDP binding domain-containing protein, partial [Rectinemataceae bacterium]